MKVYLASFYCNFDTETIRIEKSCEEAFSKGNYQYVVKHHYFVSNTHSTNVLDSYLDKTLDISDKLKCFYSIEEQQVDDWIEVQKNSFFEKGEKFARMINKLKGDKECNLFY